MRTVKARYGVTFQQGALFSSLTVLQNVQLPMLEHLHISAHDGMSSPCSRCGSRACRRMRVRSFHHNSPAAWSSGRHSRARWPGPRLLFLDEPTSGLDPISAAEFDDLVLYLQKQLKLTVVMITHDLDSIFRTCNRVGVIVDRHMVSDTLDGIVQTRTRGSSRTSTANAAMPACGKG